MKISKRQEVVDETSFSDRLIRWQKRHGRRDLPWQNTRSPYHIWISEVMLQQTQVKTVIPYYCRFTSRFPDVTALARVSEDEVLAQWSGLGYYRRGSNLHRAAKRIAGEFAGVFPADFETIRSLPGIGRSTAGAISVFAFGEKRAILEGNVKRVLCRYFGMTGLSAQDEMWRTAERLLPRREIETYTQALMDLGAMICTRAGPKCSACPLRSECIAFKFNRTLEFPARTPRLRHREKTTQWLVLVSRGRVLLEKRPPVGVWANLWCFPELAQGAEPESACAARYGTVVSRKDMAPFQHAFTHFRLNVTACVLRVRPPGNRAQAPGTLWLDLSDAIAAPVPAPVRRLLESIGTQAG